MRPKFSKVGILLVAATTFVALFIACGGSSGGGDQSLRVQGKLVSGATSRTAQTIIGIPGVTVSAIGDSDVTDANGDFSLAGENPASGEILVEFVSGDLSATSIVSGLPGVPATAEVTFSLGADGTVNSTIVSIVEDGDGATPAPTETASPEPTETASPEPTETASPEPTETASPEPTETASPEPTETASPEPTETASPEPTETASPEPTETASPEPTGTPSVSCNECIRLCVAEPASGGDAALCETLCTTGFGDLIPAGLCP